MAARNVGWTPRTDFFSIIRMITHNGHYDEEDHMGQGDHIGRKTIRDAKNDPSSQNLAKVVDIDKLLLAPQVL